MLVASSWRRHSRSRPLGAHWKTWACARLHPLSSARVGQILSRSSATVRVHAVAVEFRLWRLLTVVAAVLIAASDLAATRGVSAIVLIGMCGRHMNTGKNPNSSNAGCAHRHGDQAPGPWSSKEFPHPSPRHPRLVRRGVELRRIGDCVGRAISVPLNGQTRL